MAEQNKPGWRKYFKIADTSGVMSPISGTNQFGFPGYGKNDGGTGNNTNDFVFRNYASKPKPVSWRRTETQNRMCCCPPRRHFYHTHEIQTG